MKKLLLSISFIVCFFAGFSQSIVQRSTGANTLVDPNLFTSRSFRPPVFADTAAANAQTPTTLDSCGKIIFTYDVMGFWGRVCSPKRWERVGGAGSVSFENSSSINFTGTGASTTPIVANLNVSAQQGNAVQVNGDGIFVKTFVQDGIKVPGFITWVNNYNYDVSPAVGVIGGIEYTSDWTQITLANADPTFDRIDLVVFNAGVGTDVGTISVITGIPSDDPQEPTVTDPTTQLKMAFITVTANTTQPPVPPTQDWIYINNAEWTTLSSTSRILPGSTSNPYSVPLDVQAILAQNGDNIRFTSITPPTISNFNVITFKIRSGSIWASDSRIELQWYSGASTTGNPVTFTNGTYGFTSTNFAAYQIGTIPLSDFGSLANPTNLLITVKTSGGRTISFYMDDIQLQQAVIPVMGNAWLQGGNRWNTTGILGTLDNANLTFISNNIERMRLTNTGPVLVGSTSTLFSDAFQVTGTIRGTSLRMAALQMTESGSTSTVNTNGFNLTTIYGTNGTATHTLVNGSMVFNKSQAGEGVGILTASHTNAGMGGINIGAQVANDQFPAIGTNNGYWIGTLLYNTTGDVLLFSGTSYGVSLNFNNQTSGSNPNSAWFQDYNGTTSTIPWLIKKTGQQVWKPYGLNTFAGTPAYALGVDASGNVIEFAAAGISGITADNGVTANTSTNVRWGGSLLVHTTIDGGGSFKSIFTSSTSSADSATVVIRNTNGGGTGRGLYVTSTSGVGINVNNVGSNFGGIIATSSAGQAMTATTTTTGVALVASATEGRAAGFTTNPTSANDVVPVALFGRTTTGSVANGIGGSLDFIVETSTGATDTTTRLISKLTDATFATRTSEFSITGVSNASDNQTIFTLAGSGATRLNKYGIGTFTGTPAYTLQVDASGNIIEGSLSGSVNIYNSNGTLTGARTVSTGGFATTWTGSLASNVNFSVVNTNVTNGSAISGTADGSGTGVAGTSNSSFGVNGTSTSSTGVRGGSTSGAGVEATTTSGAHALFAQAAPSSTNTIQRILQLTRLTTGTAANGIGGSIDFAVEMDNNSSTTSTQLISKLTTAASGTVTSQFIITGVNSAVTGDILTLNGNKSIRANGYGTGGIAGTAAFALAVEADGDIIEIALGGGGGGTVNSVAGTLNRITSTGGTDPIIDISASYVGQTSITTLGTIVTGTWQGTAIGDTYISSAATWNAKQAGDATLTALAGLTITNGSLIYGTGADAFAVLAAGTNGQVLSLSGGVPVWSSVGAGTMTTISGVNTNGFTWSIANPTTTPALTLGTSVTGILKGNGTAISAAVAGTDYLTPTGSAALLTSFPTLNQNTTGSAATLTTPRNINGVAFDGSANITVTAAAGTLTGTTLNSSVVNSSLTGVGTITSGTWQGTAIGLGFGGTGLTAGGSANQILGMNAAGNASQYKTFTGLNGITITHSVGGVAVSNTFNPTVQTLTDGATITWNVTNGGNAKVTLTGTGRTLVLQNPVAGYTYTIEITQGSGGSKTITTWPTGSTWTGSNTLSTTAGDVDVVVLYYNGTNLRNVLTTDYN